MGKFLLGWEAYAHQIGAVRPQQPAREIRKHLANEELDSLIKDKFTGE
jgi:hypothetical protein